MITRDDIIDILKDSVPEIQQAYDFEVLEEDWMHGGGPPEWADASLDNITDQRYASQNLVRAVEDEAAAFAKALSRMMNEYNRRAIY